MVVICLVKIHKYSPGLKRGWEVICDCKNKKEMFELYHCLKFKCGVPMNKIHLRKVGKIGDKIPYEIWLKDKSFFQNCLKDFKK